MKEACCLSSTLNFASLRALNTASSRGIQQSQPELPDESICLWSMTAGSTPKLTRSQSESSSFPRSEYALRARAAKPSEKSNTAAASIR